MRLLAGAILAGAVLVAGAAQAVPEKKLEPTFKNLGHVHGYVVLPSGEGVTGIVNLCTADGKKISQHPSFSLRKGRFDIDNLFPGKYVLTVDTIGLVVTPMGPPAPLSIEVLPNKVIRPRLVAQ